MLKQRLAEKKDLKRVVRIYNSSIEWRMSTADTSPVSVDGKIDWFKSHSIKRPLFVYEREENDVVGWASIQSFNERPAYNSTIEISIYIDHEYIGKGVGTEILSSVINYLPSIGVKTAIANIYSHNVASLKLFKNFSFELWGELPDVCEMDGRDYSVSVLGLKM